MVLQIPTKTASKVTSRFYSSPYKNPVVHFYRAVHKFRYITKKKRNLRT